MNFHRRHPQQRISEQGRSPGRNGDSLRKSSGMSEAGTEARFFIEEANHVRVGLRLGLGRKRNCGLDCCCHRHSVENFVVDPSNLFRFYELLQLATSRGLPVGFPRDAALSDAQQDRRHQHQCTGWRSRESSSPDA